MALDTDKLREEQRQRTAAFNDAATKQQQEERDRKLRRQALREAGYTRQKRFATRAGRRRPKGDEIAPDKYDQMIETGENMPKRAQEKLRQIEAQAKKDAAPKTAKRKEPDLPPEAVTLSHEKRVDGTWITTYGDKSTQEEYRDGTLVKRKADGTVTAIGHHWKKGEDPTYAVSHAPESWSLEHVKPVVNPDTGTVSYTNTSGIRVTDYSTGFSSVVDTHERERRPGMKSAGYIGGWQRKPFTLGAYPFAETETTTARAQTAQLSGSPLMQDDGRTLMQILEDAFKGDTRPESQQILRSVQRLLDTTGPG